MQVNQITLEVHRDTIQKMEDFYEVHADFQNPSYLLFEYKNEDVQVHAYYSKKKPDIFRVSFLGKNAYEEAKIWDENVLLPLEEEKPLPTIGYLDTHDQMGADEVGTGDFFGPIVVCAAYLEEKDLPYLKELGVTDSKKISDQKIMSIGPLLEKHFTYICLVCSNTKINEQIDQGFNLNKIKAWLHNHAFYRLKKKVGKKVPCYLDEFCSPILFYNYLIDAKNVSFDIIFHTKGETYYPSIALASCIARYEFLLAMKKMEEELQMKIPLGGGEKATEAAYTLLKEKHDVSFLLPYIKKNFSNLKRMQERLIEEENQEN